MNNYEDKVMEIQNEARIFREDNKKLREELKSAIAENKLLKNQFDEDPIVQFRNNYIEVADNIFNNMRKQLLLVYEVNILLLDIFPRIS